MKRYKGQGGIGGRAPPGEIVGCCARVHVPEPAPCMLLYARYMQYSQMHYYRFFRCIKLLTDPPEAVYNLVKIKRSEASKTPRRWIRATGASHHQTLQPDRGICI